MVQHSVTVSALESDQRDHLSEGSFPAENPAKTPVAHLSMIFPWITGSSGLQDTQKHKLS